MVRRTVSTRSGHRGLAALLLLGVLSWMGATAAGVAAQGVYFPAPGDAWERRTPAEVGLNPDRVEEAVALAIASEVSSPRDLLENHQRTFGREPYGEAVGPFKERGPSTGIIVRHGYIVAEWGEPDRIDPTFSVAKSFLSTTVGLAYDRGLIRDVNDFARDYVPPIVALKGPVGQGAAMMTAASAGAASREVMLPSGSLGAGAAWDAFEVLQPFESEHNRRITWDHLLRQTSDWQGTLWGKPDWADRPRGDTQLWRSRERFEPGTNYMYNDVRVNLLALAALNVWRRPLPQVLKEHLMDPIGASPTWRWYGYDNSWVLLDGQLVQSVSGGTHWGGGLWISARDLARFGYLTLHRGRWGDRQIVSDEWVSMALTPTPVQQGYGFMNWYLRGSPATCGDRCAFYHSGAGPNIVYVDPEHDLVVVTRWVNNWNAVVNRIIDGIE